MRNPASFLGSTDYLGGSRATSCYPICLPLAAIFAGRTIRFETRSADGEVNRFPALARELVGEGAAVLITFGPPATPAARDETTAIPIVAVMDLVGSGIAASMASPGGNVTGVHIHNAELDVKKLEILRELLPTS